jgi:hypothetical protein
MEGSMKVQTDVKAGFGLLFINIDLDVDILLGGSCGGCGSKKHSGKC